MFSPRGRATVVTDPHGVDHRYGFGLDVDLLDEASPCPHVASCEVGEKVIDGNHMSKSIRR